jgi:hypothetical protein
MSLLRRRTIILALWAPLMVGATGCVIDISDVDLDDDWDSGKEVASAPFYRTVPLEGQDQLTLVAMNGSVSIHGEVGIQQVLVQAQRRVRAHTRREAEASLPLLSVAVSAGPEGITVETHQPTGTGGRSFVVDYEITVPRAFLLQITNGNGTVEIRGLQGEVRLDSGNGDVVLEDHVGSSWVSLGNGEIRADVVLPTGGQVVHAVGNGGIRLAVQQDVSATFSAHVGNGVITVTRLEFSEWVSGARFAEGVLGSGDGYIGLSVGNGWIQAQGS